MDYQFFREKGYFKFPPILQIEITQKCPLSCPQCYKNLDEKEMPFDFKGFYNKCKQEWN